MLSEVGGTKDWLGHIGDPELMERRMAWSQRNLQTALAKSPDLGVIGRNKTGGSGKGSIKGRRRKNALIGARIDEEETSRDAVEDGDC